MFLRVQVWVLIHNFFHEKLTRQPTGRVEARSLASRKRIV